MTAIGWFSVAANHTSSVFRAASAALAFVPSANYLIILLFKCIFTLVPCSVITTNHCYLLVLRCSERTVDLCPDV